MNISLLSLLPNLFTHAGGVAPFPIGVLNDLSSVPSTPTSFEKKGNIKIILSFIPLINYSTPILLQPWSGQKKIKTSNFFIATDIDIDTAPYCAMLYDVIILKVKSR